MARTLEDIASLVAAELERLDESRQAIVRRRLVPFELRDLDWNYGTGEERYPCWVVASAGNVTLVYCDEGFGPSYPWGYVLDGDGMGMDSQWHVGLEHAAIGAGWIQGRPGYRVP